MVQDLDAGPVQTIAFSAVPAAPPPRATAGELELFVARDFVVSTSTGNIVAVRASSFDDASGEEPSHKLLVQVLCCCLLPLLQPTALIDTVTGTCSQGILLGADARRPATHSCWWQCHWWSMLRKCGPLTVAIVATDTPSLTWSWKRIPGKRHVAQMLADLQDIRAGGSVTGGPRSGTESIRKHVCISTCLSCLVVALYQCTSMPSHMCLPYTIMYNHKRTHNICKIIHVESTGVSGSH